MSVPALVEYESLARSNASHMEQMEQAAIRVIRSGWYILGQEVAAFEAEFARYIGARHCIGVGNGLDALALSIDALDLPRSSDVLVPSNTYIATILAIIRAGHRPVLVEPVPETFNLDPDRLGAALTARTRALCITHLFGKACRMDAIVAFAQQHGLRLIEDCAQSHGARWNGKMTGTFGDAGCFSFFPTKNLGAVGDGGAVVTDDDALAERLRHLRNYGSKEQYVNRYVGANSRLDEIQAAILRVKLQHLGALTSHKRGLAELYFALLPDWVIKPTRNDEEFDVFHIFAIRDPRRDALRNHLLSRGIKTAIHYPTPPHRQEAMRTWLQGEYPIADELHRTELSLPISYGHTPDDVRLVCAAMHAFSG
jgi:dTDP-4-amino-4,6-dideoxygalactose transaminase